MASGFDNLPYEVLCRIIHYLSSSKKDLRQVQLANKRCLSIAEEHLYKEFELSDPFARFNRPPYFQFVLNPQRCKLVKVLRIDQRSISTLDKSFLVMFPNIQRLHSIHFYESLNWSCFSKIFTAKLCKLKEVPYFSTCEEDRAKGCIKMLHIHHQTLEKLEFGHADSSLSYQIVKSINNKRWTFPKVKHIDILDLKEGTLQDLDAIINKCPLLGELNLYAGTKMHLTDRLPDTQHQLVKEVSATVSCSTFLKVCSYLDTKFPNVESWKLSTNFVLECPEEDDHIIPLNEVIDFLNSSSLTKSKNMQLNFIVKYSSLPKALDFFEALNPSRSLSIKYSFVHRIVGLLVNERNSEAAELTVHSNVVITYLPIGLGHMDLIETVGHRIQKLELDIHRDTHFGNMTPRGRQMLRGGLISHTLVNCPVLKSLEISIPSLEYLDPVDTANASVETIIIRTESIDEELLLNLSAQVPNLKVFYIGHGFGDLDFEGSRKLAINMPYSNFDLLDITLDLDRNSSRELPDYAIVQIISTTRPTTRYYFKKCKNNDPQMIFKWRFEEKEYDGTDSLCSYTEITCRSIKSFRVSFNLSGFTEIAFVSKIIQ